MFASDANVTPPHITAVTVFGLSLILISSDSAVAQTRATTEAARAYEQCKIAFKNKEYEKAIEFATDALAIDSKHIRAFRYRGASYMNLKEPEKAIRDFTAAIEIDDSSAGAYFDRAGANGVLRRWTASCRDYEQAARREPKWAMAHAGYGFALIHLQRPSDALAQIDKALAIDPGYVLAYYYRAFAHSLLGSYEKAISDYEASVRLSAEYWYVLSDYASLLSTCEDAQIRDGQKAIRHAKRACELTEWKNRECIGAYAAAHAEIGKFDEAVKWGTRALEMCTTDSERIEVGSELQSYKALKPLRARPHI